MNIKKNRTIGIRTDDHFLRLLESASKMYNASKSEIMNFVAVPGHWGTLPLSMKGALNGTTSKNIYRRFQGRRR